MQPTQGKGVGRGGTGVGIRLRELESDWQGLAELAGVGPASWAQLGGSEQPSPLQQLSLAQDGNAESVKGSYSPYKADSSGEASGAFGNC